MGIRVTPFTFEFFVLFSVEIAVSESCVDTYNRITQEISYPQTNNSNATHSKCSWKITVPDDRSVILDIIDLQIELSSNCEQSSLEVFDGPDDNFMKIGGKLCGSQTGGILESTGNELYLMYSSNGSLIDGDQLKIKCSVSGKSM